MIAAIEQQRPAVPDLRHVVLGTVLAEPLLLAPRRPAHLELSARRCGLDQ